MHRTFDIDGCLLGEDRGTRPLHTGTYSADGRPLDGPAGRPTAPLPAPASAAIVNERLDKTTDRLAQIMAAVVTITRAADPAQFTAEGKPRIEAVREVAGLDDISASERDRAVVSLQQDED